MGWKVGKRGLGCTPLKKCWVMLMSQFLKIPLTWRKKSANFALHGAPFLALMCCFFAAVGDITNAVNKAGKQGQWEVYRCLCKIPIPCFNFSPYLNTMYGTYFHRILIFMVIPSQIYMTIPSLNSVPSPISMVFLSLISMVSPSQISIVFP